MDLLSTARLDYMLLYSGIRSVYLIE